MPPHAAVASRIAVNGCLLAVPLLPLLVGLWLSVIAIAQPPRPRASLRIWTVGPTVAATILLALFTLSAAFPHLPIGTTVAYGGYLVHLGPFYADIALVFDRTTAAFGLPTGFVLSMVLTWLTAQAPTSRRSTLAFAAGNFLAAGAFAWLLADSGPFFVLSAVIVSLSGAVLVRLLHRAPCIWWLPLPGDLLLAGACAMIFPFGGLRAPSASTPTSPVQLSAVAEVLEHAPGVDVPVPAGLVGRGLITMTTLPGTDVYLDQGTTPWQRTPFARVPVGAGFHTLKVGKRPGREELVVPSFRVNEAEETRVLTLGPSFTFSDLAAQLATEPKSKTPGAPEVPAIPWWNPLVAAYLLLAAGLFQKLVGVTNVAPRVASSPLGRAVAAVTLLLGAYGLVRWMFLPLAALREPLANFAFAWAFLLALVAIFRSPRAINGALVPIQFFLAVGAAALGLPVAVVLFSLSALAIVAESLAAGSVWSSPEDVNVLRGAPVDRWARASLTLFPLAVANLGAFAQVLAQLVPDASHHKMLFGTVILILPTMSLALWRHQSAVAHAAPGLSRLRAWLLGSMWLAGAIVTAGSFLSPRTPPAAWAWWYFSAPLPSAPTAFFAVKTALSVGLVALLAILSWHIGKRWATKPHVVRREANDAP